MVYNPQRLLRQMGYNHAVVLISRELATSSALVAEARFVEGRYQILTGRERMFCQVLG